MKSSTLWTHYSILKSTLNIKHQIDLPKYSKLKSLLKRKSEGYKGKKSKVFSPDELKTFINEAPDIKYLMIKVSTYTYQLVVTISMNVVKCEGENIR